MFKRVGFTLAGLLVLLAVVPATAPVQLSYVYSDSMEPTIDRHDGYVLVSGGEAQPGDIVTYWSAERDAYVTHRVVGVSDRGLITQGDNNAKTDQATGAAYVQQDDVVGEVVTLYGAPLVIPELGAAVRFVDTNQRFVAGALAALLAIGLLRGRQGARPSREVPRARSVLLTVLAVAFVSAVALQVVGGNGEQLQYVAVEPHTADGGQLAVGEHSTHEVMVNRSSIPYTTFAVSGSGATVVDRTRNESATTLTLRIPPPEDTGVVRVALQSNRYPAVLPAGVIRDLHRLSPLLAAVVTGGLALLPVALLAGLLIDGRQPLRHVEHRWTRAVKRRWRNL
jgi:signal peptidase